MAAANDARGFQGKLPPQNLEAEMGVLGSIMLMHEAIDEVGDLLIADHFYADRHQKMFAAVMGLYENGIRGIDAVTLAEELDRRKQLDEIGGVEYLAKILETVPNAAHAKYYAKIVRDRWIQRSLVYACTEILDECYSGSRETDDVLHSAEQRVFGILEQQVKADKIQLGDILIDTFDRIRARLELEGTISGLSSGFTDLDEKLNGFQGFGNHHPGCSAEHGKNGAGLQHRRIRRDGLEEGLPHLQPGNVQVGIGRASAVHSREGQRAPTPCGNDRRSRTRTIDEGRFGAKLL